MKIMRLLAILAALPLAACMATEPDTVAIKAVSSADLVNSAGEKMGVATLSLQDDGIWLEISAKAPGQGAFGMHIHSVGKCDAPDFVTAGPHWNPGMRQHGLDNPSGAHAGDLPNVVANAEGQISHRTQISGASWEGEGGLFDADGAAMIIHERADDYRTDPTGNSGKRVYCGVFTRN